jgi:AcrR family transcriptional regulator
MSPTTLAAAPSRKPAKATGPAGTPRRPRSAAPAARAQLTPEAWVDAATQVLVDQGIDHVRVDVLAGQLNVTRGSFYWHFRDREDLLRRVLQAWRDRSTVQLTQRLQHAGTEPLAQLLDVISLPFRGRAAARAARIELAIRAWARRDAMAREAVDEADAARIAYHAQIFTALGFEPAEAQHRAFVLYSCEVAESLLHRQGTPAQRQARQQFLATLMQGVPARR